MICKFSGCNKDVTCSHHLARYCDEHKRVDKRVRICLRRGCDEVAFGKGTYCEKHIKSYLFISYRRIMGERWLENEVNVEFALSLFRGGDLSKFLETPLRRAYLSLVNKIAKRVSGVGNHKLEIYRNHLWKVCRHYFLLENPVCVCGSRENLVVDHHKYPDDISSFLYFDNLRTMCRVCHDKKSLLYDMLIWHSRKLKNEGYVEEHDVIRGVAGQVLDKFYARLRKVRRSA